MAGVSIIDRKVAQIGIIEHHKPNPVFGNDDDWCPRAELAYTSLFLAFIYFAKSFHDSSRSKDESRKYYASYGKLRGSTGILDFSSATRSCKVA